MQQAHEPIILDHMAALSESARCRLIGLLEEQELTVSDLCTVLQLPQSTVSRHLKALLDRGWVAARRDRTKRLYYTTLEALDESARRIWEIARGELEDTPTRRDDRDRLRSVLAQRRTRSLEFFDTESDRWDAIRDELFGTHFYRFALGGLVPRDASVVDLGCGTGTVAEALAPFVEKVTGVDASQPMLDHARRRLAGFDNVTLKRGELESLPVPDGVADIATMILVLHHLEIPDAAVAEAARCLRPGGRILIVDMLPHDRAHYQKEKGHVWLGFSEETINEYLDAAGFEAPRFHALPAQPEAKGPNLFAVSAYLRSEKA